MSGSPPNQRKKRDSVAAIIFAIFAVGAFTWLYNANHRDAADLANKKAAAEATAREGVSKGYLDLSYSDQPVDLSYAPPQYQLTFLDSGKTPIGSDIHAARIRYLLGMISERTGDTPQHIADRTARCIVVLKQDYGKAVTNERFLEEANDYFNARGPKANYDDLSATLVITLGR